MTIMKKMLNMKKSILKQTCLLVLILVSLALSACSYSSPASVTFFPVHKEPQTIILLVQLQGTLTADDGYLRVSGKLVIWPYGYSYKIENNEIWILDNKGQTVAKVGDSVMLGGGVAERFFAEEKIGQSLPAGCEGPYWLAGQITKSE
jgi:hypothetical protein